MSIQEMMSRDPKAESIVSMGILSRPNQLRFQGSSGKFYQTYLFGSQGKGSVQKYSASKASFAEILFAI